MYPVWLEWKGANLEEDQKLAASGPGSEYNLMWDVIQKNFPGELEGPSELSKLKQVMSDFAKWEQDKGIPVFDFFCQDASAHCDFLDWEISTKDVVKNLYELTRPCKELEQTLPPTDFGDLLRTWMRFAYKNKQKKADGLPKVNWCNSTESLHHMKLVLNHPMTNSPIYDPKSKHNKAAQKKNMEGGADPQDDKPIKRRRGKAAQKEANEGKATNVQASAMLPLQVVRADGKTRDRQWPEDLVPSLKAAMNNVEEARQSKMAKSEAYLVAAVWAREGGQLEWRGVTYGKSWTTLRKGLKVWLAKQHDAIALSEVADTPVEDIKAEIAEKTSATRVNKQEWEEILGDPDTKALIMRFIGDTTCVVQSDAMLVNNVHFQALISSVDKGLRLAYEGHASLDLYAKFAVLHDILQNAIDDNVRSAIEDVTIWMGRNGGVLPEACRGFIGMDDLTAIHKFRGRCMLLVLQRFPQIFYAQLIKAIMVHSGLILKMDCGILEQSVWVRYCHSWWALSPLMKLSLIL